MSKNVFPGGSTTFAKDSTGVEYPLFGSTGNIYSKGVSVDFKETISWSSGGISPSTATAYGLSYISMTGTDPSTSPALVTLAAPIPGVEKVIVLDSTAAYVNTVDIDLGAGVGTNGSTTNRYIAFSTLGTAEQSITLVGESTANWAIKAVNSTLLFFGAATGIRAATAVRTS